MNPLDPAIAALRCWEHEDCLEHPELALACAGGAVTEWAAGVAEGMNGAFLTGFFGDGYGHSNGGGAGVADFYGEAHYGGGRGSGLNYDDWYVGREHERFLILDLESCYLATWETHW